MDIKSETLEFLKDECPDDLSLDEYNSGNDFSHMNDQVNNHLDGNNNYINGNTLNGNNLNGNFVNPMNSSIPNMDVDFNYNLNGYGYNNESISDKSSPSTNNSQVMTVDQLIFPPDQKPMTTNNYGISSTSSGSGNSENNLNNNSNNNNIDQAVELFSYKNMAAGDTNSSNSSTKLKKDNKERKSKRQLLDEQDAVLISKDDSQLSEAELQLKRKAQNRAAQRAFRERKETKLKDLETKLNKSEVERQQLIDQLEAIRKNNLNVLAENEALKNSTGKQPYNNFSKDFNFPKNEQQFIDGILFGSNHQFKYESRKKIYDSPENGSKVLALGATWDYLLYKVETENLNVDVVDVMDRLKGNEKCHGFGPAYPVDLIDEILEEASN